MLDGVKIDPKENFPEGSKGQARDEAAKEVGIGSGKTAKTEQLRTYQKNVVVNVVH